MIFQKPPLVATVCVCAGFVILVSLGVWQVQRLQWKEALIADLDRVYASDPAENILSAEDIATEISNASENILIRGRVQGHMNPAQEIAIAQKVHDGRVGYHIYSPLMLRDGRTLFVNRGWRESPQDVVPLNIIEVTYDGIIRTPGWPPLAPDNAPEMRHWYRALPMEMAQEFGLNPAEVLNVVMIAEAGGTGPVYTLEETHLYPRNEHLNYAIFWFTMACALIAVFVLRFCIRKN